MPGTVGHWTAWTADCARYPRGSLLTQPALWAIGMYRFGQWTRVCPRMVRPAVHAIYFVGYSIVRLVTGIDIPRGAEIGPGLMIHHFGGVIVNPRAVVGARCTLRHGVTIGSRTDDGGVPRVGDDVDLGAYAQVLGQVHVGNGARIGAMTVVLQDVPEGATVVGIPGRVLERRIERDRA